MNTQDIPQISIVIPARNEVGNIGALLTEIVDVLATQQSWEVICVDDGSSDETAEAITSVSDARITLVSHALSLGQSAALHTGVHAARGDVIVTLDGDGQNDPADIPTLLGRYRKASMPTLVVGHRVNRADSGVKRISSRIARWARAQFLGDQTPDTGCSLKVFSRAMFVRLPSFNHMHRFLTVLAADAGVEIISVPVNHRPRGAGQSNYGTFDRLVAGIWDVIGLLWLRSRRLPNLDRRTHNKVPDKDMS